MVREYQALCEACVLAKYCAPTATNDAAFGLATVSTRAATEYSSCQTRRHRPPSANNARTR
eukprot:5220907-Pyramimonas_sp.AAC.1